jgi:uncharacterized ubiquitin-like protein YukD
MSRIEDTSEKKVLTSTIIEELIPGYSIEKMRALLGRPLKIRLDNNEDWSLFEDDKNIITNSYIYKLKNAYVKINTSDNRTVGTLTIKQLFDSKQTIDLSNLVKGVFKLELGNSKVSKELIDLVQDHKAVRTMQENCAALKFYRPNPIYKTFTLFANSEKVFKYIESNEVNDLLGADIVAVCVSEPSGDSFYLFDYELY